MVSSARPGTQDEPQTIRSPLATAGKPSPQTPLYLDSGSCQVAIKDRVQINGAALCPTPVESKAHSWPGMQAGAGNQRCHLFRRFGTNEPELDALRDAQESPTVHDAVTQPPGDGRPARHAPLNDPTLCHPTLAVRHRACRSDTIADPAP